MRKSLIPAVFLFLAAAPCAQEFAPNGIKKGPWRDKDVPAGWKLTTIGRYEFQSNAPEEKVKVVAKHMNAMHDLYKKTFPAAKTPGKPFVIKIFKNREEFLAYGAPPGAGAYYSWGDKEMVGFDTGKLDGKLDEKEPGTTGQKKINPILDALRKTHTMDLLGVIAHEGWHQYFHWWCTSKVPFPSWCDEGIGEYFYTARVRGGKTVCGEPNDYRLGTIKGAIKANKHIPLKDLVTFDQRAYYARAGLCYAEGWSLVHFFLEHPEYKKQRYLTRFVTVFVDQHAIQEAVEQVFGKMDWEKTEKDWKEWVLAQKGGETEELEKALADLENLEDEPLPPGAGPDPDPKGEKPAGEKGEGEKPKPPGGG